jgi:hypothetical protein
MIHQMNQLDRHESRRSGIPPGQRRRSPAGGIGRQRDREDIEIDHPAGRTRAVDKSLAWFKDMS